MLLPDKQIQIPKPSVGIHCFQSANDPESINQIESNIRWLAKEYTVFLLPITHYNYDYEFQEMLAKKIASDTVIALPRMSAQDIYSLIGKFTYFISQSLHGAIFAYRHNVPFLL